MASENLDHHLTAWAGRASVRLPLPNAAVLQRLAKAFEPWLR